MYEYSVYVYDCVDSSCALWECDVWMSDELAHVLVLMAVYQI